MVLLLPGEYIALCQARVLGIYMHYESVDASVVHCITLAIRLTYLCSLAMFRHLAILAVLMYDMQSCFAYRKKDILEATYSFPIEKDPSVFNLEDTDTNVTILPTQLQGRVYWPRATHKDHSIPLVFMMAGKHADCRELVHVPEFGYYPIDSGTVTRSGTCDGGKSVIENYRGFDYLGRSLAKRGIAAISVDPTMLNNPEIPPVTDSSLSAARARLLLNTISRVQEWDADSRASTAALGFSLNGSTDFNSIGFFGHSRGGAGVRMAYSMLNTPDLLATQERQDWATKLNISIAGVIEVAPMYSPEDGIYTSVLGVPWMLVGAGCESDEVHYRKS